MHTGETLSIRCPRCGFDRFDIERKGEKVTKLTCRCGFETSGSDLDELVKSQVDKRIREIAVERIKAAFGRFFSAFGKH